MKKDEVEGHAKDRSLLASPEVIAALEAARALGPSSREVRRRALPRFLGWGLGAAALAHLLFSYFSEPGRTLWINLVGAGIPGGKTLVHLLELVTGVPMGEWEKRWSSLSTLAKLGVSVVVVVAAFLVLATIALILVLDHAV